MNEALDLFPADYWRWWLLSNAPETSDSDFTWKSFQLCINKDLADVLGNFVSRLTKFTISKFGTTIPNGTHYSELEFKTISELRDTFNLYDQAMNNIEIRKATSYLRKIWSVGNEYLQRTQPWVIIKSNREEAIKIIRFGFNLMLFFSVISEPFIPQTSRKVRDCLGKSQEKIKWPSFEQDFTAVFERIKFGQAFKEIENLFLKIEDQQRLELEQRFRGSNG